MIDTVITVARQYGSGGRFVAEKLAERLGIPYYDKELLTLAAKKAASVKRCSRITTKSLPVPCCFPW